MKTRFWGLCALVAVLCSCSDENIQLSGILELINKNSTGSTLRLTVAVEEAEELRLEARNAVFVSPLGNSVGSSPYRKVDSLDGNVANYEVALTTTQSPQDVVVSLIASRGARSRTVIAALAGTAEGSSGSAGQGGGGSAGQGTAGQAGGTDGGKGGEPGTSSTGGAGGAGNAGVTEAGMGGSSGSAEPGTGGAGGSENGGGGMGGEGASG